MREIENEEDEGGHDDGESVWEEERGDTLWLHESLWERCHHEAARVLRGLATLVVVERPGNRQDSHLMGKPGASQGSPLRVAPGVPLGIGGDPEPCTVDTDQLITSVQGTRAPRRRIIESDCTTMGPR